MGTRLLVAYDLETSPRLGWSYGPEWKASVIRVEKYNVLLSFSYMYLDDKKIHHVSMADFPARYKLDKFDDKDVVKALWNVLDGSEIAVAHNGVNFDNKMANTFFLKHNLGPPQPFKSVDTLRTARGQFRFSSNRLDSICKELGLKGKTKTTVGDVWYECLIENKPRAWELLRRYNNQDIKALVDMYLKLLPFMPNHPNLSIYTHRDGCPKCGSTHIQYRGYKRTNVMTYRSVWCKSCGGWSRERLRDPDETHKPEYVN